MANTPDFTQLAADVAAEKDVITSVVTLLDGLAVQIADLKAAAAANDPKAMQAAIDSLDAAVQDNKTTLANAVVANTPPAPAA